jgi:hypothetical protein
VAKLAHLLNSDACAVSALSQAQEASVGDVPFALEKLQIAERNGQLEFPSQSFEDTNLLDRDLPTSAGKPFVLQNE